MARRATTLNSIDPEQRRAVEELIAGLQKPVEEDALHKVEEERRLIMEGKFEKEVLEMTSMEEEFADLVAEITAGALTLDPEKAEERKLLMEKLEAAQAKRAGEEVQRAESAARRE